MKTTKLLRHVAGFLAGGTLFAVLIPAGLYHLSAIDRLLGLPTFADVLWRLFVAVPLGAVGGLFVLWSNLFLIIRGKGGPAEGFGVALSPRTEHLVVTGPYRWSRNPMVFGAFACYAALALLWGTTSGLMILAVFFPLAVLYVKRFEETRLVRDFGKEYEEYRKKVSMIVPLPRRT